MIQAKAEITSNYKSNANDWAKAVQKYDRNFASKLNENRTAGSDNLKKFNLKRYRHKDLSLEKFLQEPDKYLDEMKSEKFYISLKPRSNELKRKGMAGLGREDIKKIIVEFVEEKDIDNYDIAIEQMFDNVFGGTTVVDQKGNVYFEFVEGNQTPVGRGDANIKYIVFRDEPLGLFKYSFEDEEIRRIAYDAIMHIPHQGEGREMKFMPGYYEMVIAQRPGNSKPEPFFIDYRDNGAYQADWDLVRPI